jgi:hypothetical protein
MTPSPSLKARSCAGGGCLGKGTTGPEPRSRRRTPQAAPRFTGQLHRDVPSTWYRAGLQNRYMGVQIPPSLPGPLADGASRTPRLGLLHVNSTAENVRQRAAMPAAPTRWKIEKLLQKALRGSGDNCSSAACGQRWPILYRAPRPQDFRRRTPWCSRAPFRIGGHLAVGGGRRRETTGP